MNKNTNKITGGASGAGFDVKGQPTSEQKKEGWNRRRQAQEMMDKIKQYMSMTHAEFTKLLEDIKNHPEKYTVQDVLLAKYATKAFNGDKFMLDFLDRHISKAPQEISGPDGEAINTKTTVTFIDGTTGT